MKITKRAVSLLLTAALVILAVSIPANAVSSGGLPTYRFINDTQYGLCNGLKYDYQLLSIPCRTPNQAWDRTPGVFDSITYTPDTGVVEYGALITLDFVLKDDWAAATDFPIVKCWFDGELVSDGVNAKKAYDGLSEKWGYPYFSTGVTFLLDFTDGYPIPQNGGWTVRRNDSLTFDTRELSPGPHTIRFAVNPEYVSEEELTANNDFTRTVYIKSSGPAAPASPSLISTTSASVTVQSVSGQEYALRRAAEAKAVFALNESGENGYVCG